MTHSLVSVVIPCFNYARYLDDCIESIIRQSHQQWECIIVDDGSTDDTPHTCMRLSHRDSRVRFVRQENAGLSAARNAGVREAGGEFLQFLDADDVLEPEKLGMQASFLESHHEYDLIVGGAAYFSSDGSYSSWPHRLLDKGDDVLAALVKENRFPVNAVMMRREILEVIGGFDESLRAHEDWEIWLRCAQGGYRFAFLWIERGRALVRKHDANMSAATELMAATAMAVRDRLHSQLSAELQVVNERQLAEAQWRLGVHLLRAGRFNEGWTLYRKGLRSAERKSPALLQLPLLLPGVRGFGRLGRRLLRALP